MKTFGRFALCLALAAAAVGCSKSKPPPDPDANTLFKEQIHTLDRARGVQRTIDAAARRERRAIERQSR